MTTPIKPRKWALCGRHGEFYRVGDECPRCVWTYKQAEVRRERAERTAEERRALVALYDELNPPDGDGAAA